MTNADIRTAHKLLDYVSQGRAVLDDEIKLLRSFLPELPKQMTLEEIYKYVDDAWLEADDPELKEWLHELHAQLKGLEVAATIAPALPAGMRLADHEQYGRVVTSPKPNRDGIYDLLIPKPTFETGADWEYAHECELTFVDAALAEPVHPEFLETEADYQNAPEGTIVVADGGVPCHKFQSTWSSVAFVAIKDNRGMSRARRRVLRWGK